MCAHTQAHAQTLTTDRDQPRTASKPRTMFDEQPHKVQLCTKCTNSPGTS